METPFWYSEWLEKSQQQKAENQEYLKEWSKSKDSHFFELQKEAHDEAFKTVDCLQCANCCKTSPPLLLKGDINRIARHLGISPKQFVQKYTLTDTNGELSFAHIPCTFLQTDNTCSIYEIRPEACRRFPHTDEKEYAKRVQLNIKNTIVCPAAYRIVRNLAATIAEK